MNGSIITRWGDLSDDTRTCVKKAKQLVKDCQAQLIARNHGDIAEYECSNVLVAKLAEIDNLLIQLDDHDF